MAGGGGGGGERHGGYGQPLSEVVVPGKLTITEKKKERVESIGMNFLPMFVREERRRRVRFRKWLESE